MVSIVIPSHNEESTIGRCLSQLLKQDDSKNFHVVVVCNGCVDRTAEVARTYGDRVTVIETDVASKVHALNLGDELAQGFPRFYMDADVVLSATDIAEVARVLESSSFLAAAPRMRMNFCNASWSVQCYYRIWMSLPYTRQGMMGVGVYAVSETGRRQFGRFPDIIADDGYVRLLFKPHERTVVNEAQSIVTAPATLEDLIKIKTRSRLGGYQLAQRFPELCQKDVKNYGGSLVGLLRRPLLWHCVPVYLYVSVITRRRARQQLDKLDSYVWERDESSRLG